MSGLRFSRVFPSVVWQIPGYKSQRRALPALYPLGYIFYAVSSSLILVWPLWVQIPESLPTKVVNCVVLCIVCVCVLYYCHRVSIQLQLNISYHISYHITSYIIYITYTYHKSDDNACVFLRQQGNYSPRVCPWGTNCHWKFLFECSGMPTEEDSPFPPRVLSTRQLVSSSRQCTGSPDSCCTRIFSPKTSVHAQLSALLL